MQFNIKFNPTTDTLTAVQAAVAQMFTVAGVLADAKLRGTVDVGTEGVHECASVMIAAEQAARQSSNSTLAAMGNPPVEGVALNTMNARYSITAPELLKKAIEDDESGDTTTTATHDKNGLPWDARIHSTPAKQTAKGEWRAKRNVDETLVKAVEAELRGGATPAPAAPAMPTIQIQPPQVADSYTKLVAFIGEHLHTANNPTGRITDDWVKQALAAYGVTNGDLPNVRSMDVAMQDQILAGFKQALGVA